MNPDAQQKKETFIKDIVKFALLALVIIVPVRTWIAEPFIVSGLSMFPTFNDGQYLIVDQLTYDFHTPKRGDVVIFRFPLNTKQYFIKRIIGLPGETVTINDGIVSITQPTPGSGDAIVSTSTQTFTLDEPYIEADHRSYDNYKITLTSTQYFVMGDNRNQSSDSRAWGPLDQKYLIGRPYVRLLPPTKISVLPGRVDLGHN